MGKHYVVILKQINKKTSRIETFITRCCHLPEDKFVCVATKSLTGFNYSKIQELYALVFWCTCFHEFSWMLNYCTDIS